MILGGDENFPSKPQSAQRRHEEHKGESSL